MSSKGKLFLLPAPLQPYSRDVWTLSNFEFSLPARALFEYRRLSTFITESSKTAYRLLSVIRPNDDVASLSINILDEHSKEEDIFSFIRLLENGEDAGFFSEAGLPCIADPGAALAAAAHKKNITVVPISGPSSIILALIASGFDAQRFSFLGYLPQDSAQRKHVIRRIGQDTAKDHITRLFIETPYRNRALIQDLLQFLPIDMHFCFAANLDTSEQLIISRSVKQWKAFPGTLPDKVPAVFLIGYPATIKPLNTV